MISLETLSYVVAWHFWLMSSRISSTPIFEGRLHLFSSDFSGMGPSQSQQPSAYCSLWRCLAWLFASERSPSSVPSGDAPTWENGSCGWWNRPESPRTIGSVLWLPSSSGTPWTCVPFGRRSVPCVVVKPLVKTQWSYTVRKIFWAGTKNWL